MFNAGSRILVLGSFPSVLSRANDFYYGNPRNRFWRVLAQSFNCSVPADSDIAAKRELLLSHGVALWDVIDECDIKGSSDASIKNVAPVQIERVLSAAPIQAVICNGATAGRLYKRYLQWETNMPAHVLPSTSPANAAWDLERLTERWRAEFETIGAEAAALEYSSEAASENVSAAAGSSRRQASHGALAAGKAAAESAAPAPAKPKASRAPKASNYAVHRSMQGNKGKDTKPELLVRARLQQAGLTGYRLQWKAPGKPDIAWPGKRVALFINGCFWHRCPYCNPSQPKKNVEYWNAKFERNVARDKQAQADLAADGWRVHTVWECQLKKKQREDTFAELLPQLSQELNKPLR